MSRSGPLRWTVVGYGDFGRRHALAIREAGYSVTAIVEPDPDRRRLAVADEPRAFVTDDLARALSLCADIVVVATPEHAHREPVVAALATSDVLVEKPIATDLADAEAMVAAANSTGRLLSVGHLLRFDPRLVNLRTIVERGDLGEVVHISSRRHGARSSARIYQRQRPFVLSGVHDADIACWLLDADPTSVSAIAVSPLSFLTPDHEVAVVDFGGIASAVIEAGRLLADGAAARPHTVLEVIGTEASASIVDGGPLVIVDAAGEHITDVAGPPDRLAPSGMLRAQVGHVAACVDRSVAHRISALSAVTALRVMVAAGQSAADLGRRMPIR